MIMTEPVLYVSGNPVPTLLMIGQKDTTAVAKDFAPPELRPKLGNYPELGKAAAKAIPGAKLIEFPEFGHAPQMTDPEGFDKALIEGISKSSMPTERQPLNLNSAASQSEPHTMKVRGRDSINVQKVLWCCGELGLSPQRIAVGGEFGGTDDPQYVAMNRQPTGADAR